MSNQVTRFAAVLLCGAGLAISAGAASAMPAAHALAIKNAAPATVETVRWGGGWHGGWRGRGGWGWPLGGFVAGAAIGSALAAPYYYGGYYPYGYYPAYPAYPPAGYGAPPAGDATAYCAQRFRSYDPSTGTYLGFDGARHPCP
jgi:BA14K-like protein